MNAFVAEDRWLDSPSEPVTVCAHQLRLLLGPALTPGSFCLPTHRGREAIHWLCRLWGLGPGDQVLLPSYNCGSEVDPYLQNGVSVRLYRVDRDGNIDWDDLEQRVTASTRALSLTHYFGWPQDTPRARAFCDLRGLRLIEDCACALFSAAGGRAVGTLADAAIFSFRKTVPVSHGGALLLRRPPAWIPDFADPPAAWRLLDRLRFWHRRLRSGSALVGAIVHWLRQRSTARIAASAMSGREDLPAHYYFDPSRARWGVSETVLSCLATSVPDRVREERRAQYSMLVQALASNEHIRPWRATLPEGVCPCVFPMLVVDRAAWRAFFACTSTPAITWWSGYHRALPWDEFPDACFLKEHILAVSLTEPASALTRTAETVTLASITPVNKQMTLYTAA